MMGVDYELKTLRENAYNYFKRAYGTFNNSDDDNTATFRKRYDHLSKRQLKKQLMNLRAESSEEKSPEMRYISKLVRHKYGKSRL